MQLQESLKAHSLCSFPQKLHYFSGILTSLNCRSFLSIHWEQVYFQGLNLNNLRSLSVLQLKHSMGEFILSHKSLQINIFIHYVSHISFLLYILYLFSNLFNFIVLCCKNMYSFLYSSVELEFLNFLSFFDLWKKWKSVIHIWF